MYQTRDEHSQRLTGSLLVRLDPHVQQLLLFFLTPKQVLLIYLLPVLLEMLLGAPMCLVGHSSHTGGHHTLPTASLPLLQPLSHPENPNPTLHTTRESRACGRGEPG